MNKEVNVKSIRKVLGQAISEACIVANELTGKSVNALPEYFMAVKVAEYVNNHFSTFRFSMEDTLHNLCKEADINCEQIASEYRIEKTTRADLILRNKSNNKIKHIIEFKRHLHTTQLKKDVVRLAWLCANAKAGHRLEKNFLVAVTHRKSELFHKRNEQIISWVKEVSPDIAVKFEFVNTEFPSSHPKGLGKKLCGGVWEFKYKY
ncbi:MAG: hypothetical protein KKF22_05875 [Gammaproteobacteria bacterium]|nr:hypothetical protein [Gammaproteobacteria bacterium]